MRWKGETVFGERLGDSYWLATSFSQITSGVCPLLTPEGDSFRKCATGCICAQANRGPKSTFRRLGFGESIPIITLILGELNSSLLGCEVNKWYTASAHVFISYSLDEYALV